MSKTSDITTWCHTAQEDFDVIYIAFLPTRTKILTIEPQTQPKGTLRLIPESAFLLEWVVSAKTNQSLALRIEFEGETPIAEENPAYFVGHVIQPPTVETREVVYEKRQKIAAHDKRQAGLFFLDTTTHLNFIDLSELPAKKKERRKIVVDRLQNGLRARIESRLGRYTDPLPTIETADVDEITEVFAQTERRLEGECDLATLLTGFAAGEYERTITYQWRQWTRIYTISTPNSGYVFLFGELALVGLERGLAFWTPTLTLELVKMQRYYHARLNHGAQRRWYEFKEPHHALQPNDRNLIDQDYSMRNPTIMSPTEFQDLSLNNLRLLET